MPTIGTTPPYMDQGKQGVNGQTCLPVEEREPQKSEHLPVPLPAASRKGGKGLAAADPARLDPVGEGSAVGQALGVDSRQARSLDPDAGMAEAAPRAAILDRRAARLVGQDFPLAGGGFMLELKQKRRIADADRARRASLGIADLPAAALQLRKGLEIRQGQSENRRGKGDPPGQSKRPPAQTASRLRHDAGVSTKACRKRRGRCFKKTPGLSHPCRFRSRKAGLSPFLRKMAELRRPAQSWKSSIDIGKTREQNSQSTLMKPSSSTISARSPAANRPMTPRI